MYWGGGGSLWLCIGEGKRGKCWEWPCGGERKVLEYEVGEVVMAISWKTLGYQGGKVIGVRVGSKEPCLDHAVLGEL